MWFSKLPGTNLVVTLAGLFAHSEIGFAQDQSTGANSRVPGDTEKVTSSPTDGTEPLSPQEQAELEQALRADQKSQVKPGTAPEIPAVLPGVFQSLNPDISFIADVALGWFSTEEPLQMGAHDPKHTGFTLQQLEMGVSQAVDPYFRFDAFVVFGQFGVEVEEAYATTLSLPWNLQVRVGQFLTRFGRLNATHPHTWDFVDQPFILGRVFGGEGNRGVGLEGSYLTPLPWYAEIIYSVTDAAGEGTARSFFGAQNLDVRTPLDFQHTVALKQFFPVSGDWSLLWGLSMASGPNPTGHNNRTEVFGTDLYLKYRPITFGSPTIVSLQLESLYRRRQVPEDVLQDTGGYAYLFWRFDPRWGTAVRYEYGSRSWNLRGKANEDDLDPFWTASRHRIAANLTFWPTEFSRLRLQGSSDLLGWQSEPNWAGLLAFECSIGAHGAHSF